METKVYEFDSPIGLFFLKIIIKNVILVICGNKSLRFRVFL